MRSKKKAARRNQKVRRPPAEKRAKAATPAVATPTTIEEALLSGIIEGHSKARIPEDAMLFNSIMSNLTPSLQSLSRSSGIYAGRHLYSIIRSKKHYTWHEEALADLVKFFENAGYSGITYNVFPDKINMRMHDRSHEYVGMNTHSFEAGLISGFLTAARRQHASVDELECSNNGAAYCRFDFSNAGTRRHDVQKASEAIRLLGEHLARQASGSERPAELRVAPEYYALSSSTMLGSGYSSEMQAVSAHLGTILTQLMSGGKSGTAAHGKPSASKAASVIRLLNLGKPNVRSPRPVKIDIIFDRLHSRSELVDISVALLRGMFAGRTNGDLVVVKEARKGGYKISIAERVRKK